ncbi:MAG: class I SAM-dependent methyltransferase [Noviherbaspirillum sp.]
MFWEKKLESWIDEMRQQAAVPLRLQLWNGQEFALGEAPQVTVRVRDASALTYLVKPSLATLGKAYVEGLLDVDGPLGAIVAVANGLAAQGARGDGRARLSMPFRHTRKQDAEAISYHYDVSNAFYQAWLDENMVYSCAYFENGDEDLATAQRKKIDHILTKVQLQPGETLLDIGCGWGALVLRAAQQFGARCVGITLSKNQYDLATERVRQAGLQDRVEIRMQDYRDVSGTFDRITSVGMFEHVGLKNLPLYFGKIRSLLASHGLAMNHGITTTDVGNGDAPYGGGEFIGTYVFPHGELPHVGQVLTAMQEGGLEPLDVENLRRHYARTCAIWAENFEAHAGQLREMVDDKRFRIWRVYLAGCAWAFMHDWVSLNQVLCTRAGRLASELPVSRRYMYA